MALTYGKADRVLKASIAKASELGIGVSICVMDDYTNPVAVARMDKARRGTTSWASMGKTMVAAIWGVPSKETAERMNRGTSEIKEHAQALYGHRLIFLGGAVPLKEGDEIIGAVGVSGGTGEQDEEIAIAGAEVL
jgi:uncharacterized protein GlcG (DUF336 family)